MRSSTGGRAASARAHAEERQQRPNCRSDARRHDTITRGRRRRRRCLRQSRRVESAHSLVRRCALNCRKRNARARRHRSRLSTPRRRPANRVRRRAVWRSGLASASARASERARAAGVCSLRHPAYSGILIRASACAGHGDKQDESRSTQLAAALHVALLVALLVACRRSE